MSELTPAALRQKCIDANRNEFDEHYPRLTFPDPDAARRAAERREALFSAFAGRVEIGCRGTKLDMRRLSPGCRLCVEGLWSCLFINGRCNCRCFYCPADQEEIGIPTTNSVSFRTPVDYVAYLERFGFRGASLSGGEPLLTPGRTLGFLSAVKKHFGDRMHTWLYTNGTLVDREILLRLRDAGLDEIRFDIGAVGYGVERAALAVGVIPTVTVEIPAVPEEKELLKEKMAVMADAGIAHLNLHQLRLTPYNLERFANRHYTYLHGEKVTVLESELTALELIAYGAQRGIDLPVNYCSFLYKNRFQKAAARRRGGDAVRKPYEDFTSAGFIRTLALVGGAGDLVRQGEAFRCAGAAEGLCAFSPSRDRLFFAASLFPLVDFHLLRLVVGYSEGAIRETVSYRNTYVEVRLGGKKIVVERCKVMTEVEAAGEEAGRFEGLFLRGGVEGSPEKGMWSEVERFEVVPAGLQDYY